MKRIILGAILSISHIIQAATIGVEVRIDGITKQTTFNCPTAPLKNNNSFVCACEHFALKAKILQSFDDGLEIEFEFKDLKDGLVVSSPILRVRWDEPAKLACDNCENAFFELIVTATK